MLCVSACEFCFILLRLNICKNFLQLTGETLRSAENFSPRPHRICLNKQIATLYATQNPHPAHYAREPRVRPDAKPLWPLSRTLTAVSLVLVILAEPACAHFKNPAQVLAPWLAPRTLPAKVHTLGVYSLNRLSLGYSQTLPRTFHLFHCSDPTFDLNYLLRSWPLTPPHPTPLLHPPPPTFSTGPILPFCALNTQNMSRNSNPVPEIDISTNWHTVPTSGDLLANDTNDLAYGAYDAFLVDCEQQQIPITLGDISDPDCPGYAHCCGMTVAILKGTNTAIKLHNTNLDNSLPLDVHHSITKFLTSASETNLQNEVAKDLDAPPCILLWPGLGNDGHGANVQDLYTFAFTRSFHIKMAAIHGQPHLLLPNILLNCLVKPFFFSPVVQSYWTHPAVLNIPAGLSRLSLRLHPPHFSWSCMYLSPLLSCRAPSLTRGTLLSYCSAGRRSIPKGRHFWSTLANLLKALLKPASCPSSKA